MDGHSQRKRIARTEGGSDGETRLLPDDVLADVLRRLAPRWLAASRCVCKAWRATVDARRLLRADLLPLWLAGIIVNFARHENSPEFFSRRLPPVGGMLENLTARRPRDHCNGLLLSYGVGRRGYVSNPATGWEVPLPPCPSAGSEMEGDFYREHLVFDPTVSTHYQVFRVPHLGNRLRHAHDPLLEKSEWPPSQLIMHVFSSLTGAWEERTFSREGEAAGTVADIRSTIEQTYDSLYSEGTVYWRGALYVNSVPDFVMRICSSDSKYRVIKTPSEYHYLARSEKGVYLASLCDLRIQVWILNEFFEWVLKHDNDLKPVLSRRHSNPLIGETWFLQSVKGYPSFLDILPDSPEEVSEEEISGWNSPLRKDNFTWNSDGDYVPAPPDDDTCMFQDYDYDDVDILGFHSYKEIVFLSRSPELGLAYHLNSSKVQVLGSLSQANNGFLLDSGWDGFCSVSLPYTPCWIEEFSGNN